MRPKGSGRQPLIDRITEKIGPVNGPKHCRDWTGAVKINKSGMRYGAVQVWDEPTQKWTLRKVTRELWQIQNGPIPSETPLVLHTCDNSLCCEIAHLYLGTHADNMRDMTTRKRAAVGEKNGQALYPDRRARGERSGWYTHPENRKYGDDNPARKHPERLARGEQQGLSKLTDDKVREIRRLWATGEYRQADIAAIFGIVQGTVGFILRGKTWTHVT